LRQGAEGNLGFHEGAGWSERLQETPEPGLDHLMLELGARHWHDLSVAEFMVHGAVVFREFAKLLDGHEAGGSRHTVNSRRIGGFCRTKHISSRKAVGFTGACGPSPTAGTAQMLARADADRYNGKKAMGRWSTPA
jgi:hypothetical protein